MLYFSYGSNMSKRKIVDRVTYDLLYEQLAQYKNKGEQVCV